MKTLALLLLYILSCHGQDHAAPQENPASAVHDVQSTSRTFLRQRDQSDRELSGSTTRVMVQYTNDQGKDEIIARSARLYHDFHKRNVIAVEIDEHDLQELRNSPNIRSIEEDRIYEAQGFHEQTLTEEEHNHRRLQQTTPYGISMVQADQLSVGRNRVKVCIADTGVARKHPDLQRRFSRGANRNSSINGAQLYWRIDARGHGTHVTGTINAANNGFGVRGIGAIPVYMTRALDDNGQARESDVYGAVEQCLYSGAKVISMSLGGGGMSQTFKDLLTSLYDDHGFLLVAASGNNGQNAVSWPAAHPRVVAVGAVQEDRSIWPNSNYGSQVELAAPGRMILSTTVNSVGAYVYRYVLGLSILLLSFGVARNLTLI
jgi:serine protease